jgi:hypothetical protein
MPPHLFHRTFFPSCCTIISHLWHKGFRYATTAFNITLHLLPTPCVCVSYECHNIKVFIIKEPFPARYKLNYEILCTRKPRCKVFTVGIPSCHLMKFQFKKIIGLSSCQHNSRYCFTDSYFILVVLTLYGYVTKRCVWHTSIHLCAFVGFHTISGTRHVSTCVGHLQAVFI